MNPIERALATADRVIAATAEIERISRGEPAPEPVAVKVGDFFVSSWGWDQTNIDYYRVTEVSPSGKTVKVQAWQSKQSEDQPNAPYSTHVEPGGGPRQVRRTQMDASGKLDFTLPQITVDAPITRRKLLPEFGRPGFRVNSYAIAQLWDGRASGETGFGFGH